jgi:hypothetical protein
MCILKADRHASISRLQQHLKPGDVVHTVLRNTSRSSMTRAISLIKLQDGEPLYLSYHVAQALGRKGVDAIVCCGFGLDLGFDLVYQLGQVLYQDGYALKHRWL